MKPCLITRGESIIQLLSHEYPGWWFQPLWKILVSWVYSSQYIYMEKQKMFQTTNRYPIIFYKPYNKPWYKNHIKYS